MADAMERLNAALVDRYRLERELGRGGMATVYLASDLRHDRPVALKVLEPAAAAAIGPQRFLHEIRITARLIHPHILPLLDSGEADGLLYYVMPYVEGESLRDLLNRERQLPVESALQTAAEVADALGYAHRHDVVHRDIKPENILLEAGHAVVADFGVAHAVPAAAEPRMTATGMAIGTPAYMSPEQALGEPHLDARSDLYSLACVLYEMLAGELPFSGPTLQAINARRLADPVPSLRTVRPSVPPAVERAIEKALAKLPADRFETVDQFAAALQRQEPEATVEGRPGDVAEVEPPRARTSPPQVIAAREQHIRFCTTSDGVRLAYATLGSGPFIIRVLGHFTHLEKEWEWPDLRRLWEELAERHTVVRYDGRGIGLSDPYSGEFTEETRQRDLEAVLTAVAAKRAALLGISEGGWTAATYANRHPERVSHLVFYGAYCRGARARPGFDPDEDRALATLIRKGWGRDTPAFRQIFTSQFFLDDAEPGLIAHFNQMQRLSADPETAARYHESCHRRGDGRDLYRQVKHPSLVIHCREDVNVSAEEGRLLASIIPGAQLVLLPGGSHYFPTDTDVAMKVAASITRFLRTSPVRS